MARKRKTETVDSGWVTRVRKEFHDEFLAEKQAIDEFRKKLFEGPTPLSHKLTKIESEAELKQRQIVEFHEKSQEYYEYLLDSDDEGTSLKEDIDEIVQGVKETKDESDQVMMEIRAFHEFIEGSEDEEEGESELGFRQELKELKLRQENLISTWEKKFDKTHDRIETLLSGATTVSLAKSYEDHKNTFEEPSKNWSRIFFLCITLMFLIGVNAVWNQDDATELLTGLLLRIPLFVPVVWLAIYASKQQSQNKRLTQEYAYKESLARSYEGFKKQIDALGQHEERKDLQAKLISVILDVSSENPSETLDSKSHKDGPPGFKDLVDAARTRLSNSE